MNCLNIFFGGIAIIVFAAIMIIFNIFFFVFILKNVMSLFRNIANRNYFKNNVIVSKGPLKYNNVYNDVSKKELSIFNIDDINMLKDYFYNKFIEFELAYTDLDYTTLKLLCTKQLYNSYYTGITLGLKEGKRRMISDIEKINVIVFELDSTVAKLIASVMIEISYFNYMVDKNNKLISGDCNNRVVEKFEVTFRKDFSKKNITNCPNCGAHLSNNRCYYCDSIIDNNDFKINSIRKIIE